MQNVQKQRKNVQSLQYWQFQNLSILVSMHLFWKEKSTQGFKSQTSQKITLGFQVFQNYMFSPWKSKNSKIGPWEILKNGKMANLVLVLFVLATLVLVIYFGEITFSPLDFGEITLLVLVNLQTKRTLPYYYPIPTLLPNAIPDPWVHPKAHLLAHSILIKTSGQHSQTKQARALFIVPKLSLIIRLVSTSPSSFSPNPHQTQLIPTPTPIHPPSS